MPQGLVLLITFLASMCSLCYELLLAKTVADISNEEVISQCLTIGVYLLGLGLGTFSPSWFPSARPLRKLFWIEVFLTTLGSAAPYLIYLFTAGLQVFFSELMIEWSEPANGSLLLVWLFQPLALAVGYLSGFEIPLLLQSLEDHTPHRNTKSLILGTSYLGALVAGFMMPLYLVPSWGIVPSGVLIGLVNFGCAFLLLRPAGYGVFRWQLGYLIIPTLVIFGIAKSEKLISQVFLKVNYLEISQERISAASFKNLFQSLKSFGPIHRVVSDYQNIDILDYEVYRRYPVPPEFSLYLNRQPQFSESTLASYHQGMVHGSLNLAKLVPSRLLILGGGDGFIAAELLRYPEIKEIILVELDPVMVEICKTHPAIRQLNGGALESPRVHIVIDDAYRFLRRNSQPFAGVFVDFPYPVSFELSKLYSVEFYSALKRNISENGFAVLDAPLWKNLDAPTDRRPLPQDILFSTLTAAGFKELFAYGPMDPFIYISPSAQPVSFDYDLLPATLAPRGLLNLTDLRHMLKDLRISPNYVNSIFRPLRFHY